jgi:hypothetical protein
MSRMLDESRPIGASCLQFLHFQLYVAETTSTSGSAPLSSTTHAKPRAILARRCWLIALM